MDYYLGIDPGVNGAFALINSQAHIVEIGNFTTWNNFFKLLNRYQIQGAVLESVHIWGGSAAQSSTTFMKNAGGYEALLDVANIRHQLVVPQVWQKAVGCAIQKAKIQDKTQKAKHDREHRKKCKAKSIEIAYKFYGLNPEQLDEHKADALNMARYAKMIFS